MTHEYPELISACAEMLRQSEFYRPTSFWAEAARRIAEEISAHGVANFRSLPLPLDFFVPTYGRPGNNFTGVQAEALLRVLSRDNPEATKPRLVLEKLLSGELSAEADFRVVSAADDCERQPYLHMFSESGIGEPIEQFEFGGRRFSRSSLNYLLGLTMLKKHLRDGEVPRTVMEIGGGFGTLGEILNSSGIDGLKYINLDLPPVSFICDWYLRQVAGREVVTTHAMTVGRSVIEISDLTRLSVLCAWQIEQIRGSVDLFVNFISFQEMEPRIVQNYLHHVSRLGAKWILLRNMREGKQKVVPGVSVGVEVPILSDDYINMLNGYQLIERSIYPFGLRTVDGYNSELLLFKRQTTY